MMEAAFNIWTEASLDLDRPLPLTRQCQNQVDFGAGRTAIEVGQRTLGHSRNQSFDYKAFPTRSAYWMTKEVIQGFQSK